LFFEVGQIIAEDDVLPRSHYGTPFFKERVEPQGYVDSLATILEKSAVSCAVLSALRTERTAWSTRNSADPWIRSAARASSAVIGKSSTYTRSNAAAMADTLDGLPPACFGRQDRADRPRECQWSCHARSR